MFTPGGRVYQGKFYTMRHVFGKGLLDHFREELSYLGWENPGKACAFGKFFLQNEVRVQGQNVQTDALAINDKGHVKRGTGDGRGLRREQMLGGIHKSVLQGQLKAVCCEEWVGEPMPEDLKPQH
jgi:hypothetical protein